MFFGWSWTPRLPQGSFDPAEQESILASNESKLARTPWAINVFRYKTSPVGEYTFLSIRLRLINRDAYCIFPVP